MAADKPVRDASDRCNIAQSNYFAAFGARPDVYRALVEVERSQTARTVADKKLLEYYLVSARRSGAALSPDKRKTFIALSDQLTALTSKWQETLNNDATTLTLTADQAASLPAGFVNALTHNDDGTYTVKVNESTVTPFLQNERDVGGAQGDISWPITTAPRPTSRCSKRPSTFAIDLPTCWVSIRGPLISWPHRMAQTPARVLSFERSLDAQLLPQAKRELAGWALLKAQETGNPSAAIEPWDVIYYYNQLVKTKYSVDNEQIRQYFPVDVVIDRIMNLYHKILGVTFVKVADPNAWAPDVISYNVFDTKSGRFIGTTYFDLLPAARQVLALRELAARTGAPASRWQLSAAGHRHSRQLAASGARRAGVAFA